MADILIRGMEMPEGDNKISIIIFSNGKVSLAHDKKYAEYAEAVPLPEGHGRLGDLDALQEEFKKSHDGKKLMLIDTAPTIIEADLEWKMKNCCCFSNTDHAEGGTGDGA
jgi:hypothetical protein